LHSDLGDEDDLSGEMADLNRRAMLRRGSLADVKNVRPRMGDVMSFQQFSKSPAIYFLGCQTCPNCREAVFAADGADVTSDAITYRWTCDLCNHSFTTDAAFEEIAA
jgi:hypothetical protein